VILVSWKIPEEKQKLLMSKRYNMLLDYDFSFLENPGRDQQPQKKKTFISKLFSSIFFEFREKKNFLVLNGPTKKSFIILLLFFHLYRNLHQKPKVAKIKFKKLKMQQSKVKVEKFESLKIFTFEHNRKLVEIGSCCFRKRRKKYKKIYKKY
jgi:hypothetical protein